MSITDEQSIEHRVELAQRVQAIFRDEYVGDAFDVFVILLAGAAAQLEMAPEQVFKELQRSLYKARELKKRSFFRCESCPNVFSHPDVGECETSGGGGCEHLHAAGWRPVWVRIMSDHRPDHDTRRRVILAARGGWICDACRQKFMPRDRGHDV